jgi:flagellar FliL protein
MKKIFQILPKILLILVVIPLLGINLAAAYIMFAPDTWPKPFYLMYAFPPEPEPKEGAEKPAPSHSESNQVAHAAAPEGGSEHEGAAPLAAPLEIRPGQGMMVDTGTKIVNLVDPTGRRYLRAGVVLEFAPRDMLFYTLMGEEKTLYLETFNEEINVILPVINDIVITALSSQTFETVYTAEGKEKLRQTIMNTVNGQIPEQRVIFVYFTEFVVQ